MGVGTSAFLRQPDLPELDRNRREPLPERDAELALVARQLAFVAQAGERGFVSLSAGRPSSVPFVREVLKLDDEP